MAKSPKNSKMTPAQKAKAEADAKKVVARNRRATHDYFIEDKLEVGLVLTGTEVKALRMGRASLAEAWVEIYEGEAWLRQANIPEYLQGTWNNHAPTRKRKILMHKDQILKWQQNSQAKGYTIVPLELYFINGRAKLLIGLGRGKQQWDKRQALREAQDKREAQREMQRFAKGHR